MKHFDFRLARVLRVRRIEEQVARAEFLERQVMANEAQEASQRALEGRLLIESQLAEEIETGPLDPRSAIRAQDSIDGMGRVWLRRSEHAKTLAVQAEQARAPWIEVRTDVRALEHIEERKRERFSSEVERRANRELDETAARRAKRPNSVRQQEDRSK